MDKNIEQKLTNLFQAYPLQKYKKKDLIFQPGNTFSEICFVKNGYVRLFIKTKDDKEVTINLFKPVFYLSLMFASNNSENKYYFEAINDVELWKAPADIVLNFLNQDQDSLHWLNRKLLKTQEELLTNIVDATSGNSVNKIIAIILSLALKFGTTSPEGITIDFKTTHKVLASIAGTSRETVSIQIKKLEREGLIIQKQGKLLIPNIEKLQNTSTS